MRQYQLLLWGASPVEFTDALNDALRLTRLISETRRVLLSTFPYRYSRRATVESPGAASFDIEPVDDEAARKFSEFRGTEEKFLLEGATTYDPAEKLVAILKAGQATIKSARAALVGKWLDKAAMRIHSPVTCCGVSASNAHAQASRIFCRMVDDIDGARGWHTWGLDVDAAQAFWADIAVEAMPFLGKITPQRLERLDATIQRESQVARKLFDRRKTRRKTASPQLPSSQPAATKTTNDLPDQDAPTPANDERPAHSIDFRSVNWFGAPYTFSEHQAACVKILWEHWLQRTPDVGGKTLLAEAESDAERIDLVFRDHPAWNTMIVKGVKRGTRRLQEPARARIDT